MRTNLLLLIAACGSEPPPLPARTPPPAPPAATLAPAPITSAPAPSPEPVAPADYEKRHYRLGEIAVAIAVPPTLGSKHTAGDVHLTSCGAAAYAPSSARLFSMSLMVMMIDGKPWIGVGRKR
jgi:hypothetical protein